MKHTIIIVCTILAVFGSSKTVSANEYEVTQSAHIAGPVVINKAYSSTQDIDSRKIILKQFLSSHNSPITQSADVFVENADKYNLDWRLVPAITGVESTFGKHIPYNSYNAYGWANGDYKFRSWNDSISHVSKTLRLKYIDRGVNSVDKIARVYAPPSHTWGGKVKFFMNRIDKFPTQYDL